MNRRPLSGKSCGAMPFDDSLTIACPNCGNSAPPACAKCGAVAEATDALFCSKCGAALASSAPHSETTKTCPSCGSTIPGAAKICGACNSYLPREPAVPAPQPKAARGAREDTRSHGATEVEWEPAGAHSGQFWRVVIIAVLLAGVGYLAFLVFRPAQEANGVKNTSLPATNGSEACTAPRPSLPPLTSGKPCTCGSG
jgi:predicted RNA-binding Zn-ribbon protein involved in translation (DUF1610 family)